MSSVRSGQPGATRVCPHCKSTVLESAAVCPGCRHHLRFGGAAEQEAENTYSALSVDGTIAHKETQEPCEYCVVLDVRNDRGEQVLRQVIGVGALQPGERRHLNVSVNMLPVRAPVAVAKPAPAPPARAPAPLAAAAKPGSGLQPLKPPPPPPKMPEVQVTRKTPGPKSSSATGTHHIPTHGSGIFRKP